MYLPIYTYTNYRFTPQGETVESMTCGRCATAGRMRCAARERRTNLYHIVYGRWKGDIGIVQFTHCEHLTGMRWRKYKRIAKTDSLAADAAAADGITRMLAEIEATTPRPEYRLAAMSRRLYAK